MTADEVIEAVAAMPSEEWPRIQAGIADLFAARFSGAERTEISEALMEAETEFGRGEGLDGEAMRGHFGLS